MVRFTGPPATATRNRPITSRLRQILEEAALEVGVDHVHITSGGQPGTHGRRTGSTRHDGGRAADIQLFINGRAQTFTDGSGGAVVEGFVTAVAARGCNGIGAGVGYMGNRTLHIGFGATEHDHRRLVWGAGGRSANAPGWLRRAAEAGWTAPAPAGGAIPAEDREAGRYMVVARSGLNLRKGPGLHFSVAEILPTGTVVTVDGFEGDAGEWARVDLADDGILDGHVFASFLKPLGGEGASSEHAEEPGEEGDD